MTQKLASDEIAVGHCVIINDCDQPCTKLIAVVVHVQPDKVVAKYIAKAVGMNVCWNGRPECVTPVYQFGADVFTDGNDVWCEQLRPSTATYPDGEHRRWQEYNPGIRWPVKVDVLAKAIRKGGEA